MLQSPRDGDASKCWTQLWNVLEQLLPRTLHPFFFLHMSTRHFSARIQAFQTMYKQKGFSGTAASACAVASLHGEVFTDAGKLKEALLGSARDRHKHTSQSDSPSQIDHILHGPYRPQCHVVLYAAPMDAGFLDMDTAITKAIRDGAECSYALRPVLLDNCAVPPSPCFHVGTGAPPVLAGYGVELSIKDTEYNQVRASFSIIGSAGLLAIQRVMQSGLRLLLPYKYTMASQYPASL